MSKRSLFCVLALATLTSYAAGVGLKPGLWEVKLVKQFVDGRDMTAQITAGAERMQQMMANMTPDQRARMQASMPKAADNGNFRICISPEFAKRDQPIIDKEGHCQPATVKHDGNVTSYEFSCSSNGASRRGKGEIVSNGDALTNRVDMTMTQSSGQTRNFHNESEMHYLGPDCGDVKPLDVPK